ncbi:MAG: hypothetical protein C4547_01415 [Phycisphaerales bacterium]|nr:MAG: hypothetical protein C4547_01415 [Phycisphaerales bacterium]
MGGRFEHSARRADEVRNESFVRPPGGGLGGGVSQGLKPLATHVRPPGEEKNTRGLKPAARFFHAAKVALRRGEEAPQEVPRGVRFEAPSNRSGPRGWKPAARFDRAAKVALASAAAIHAEAIHAGATRTAAILAVAMFTAAILAAPAPAAHAGGPSFAIRNVTILPVDPAAPWIIENGVLIVRHGKIAAVGSGLDVPADLRVLDGRGGVLVPGFVAAASLVGGGHAGDESVAARYRAVDGFDRYADYLTTLAEGVTTAYVDPGVHRLLTGMGAVVKLAGGPDERVLKDASELCVNLGDFVYNPPDFVTYNQPASSDIAIVPARIQRPASRLDQLLALDEAIQEALTGAAGEYSIHRAALNSAWEGQTPLRIFAQRAADLEQAVLWLKKSGRSGYVVGGAEAHRVAGVLREHRVPLVYRAGDPFAYPAGNVGFDPNALDDSLHSLDGVTLAIASPFGQATAHLRLAAVAALEAGLDERRVLEGITRVPAEILGVADRVGSLAVGKDADFLVMSGPPLELTSHVLRAYVGGRIAFEPPPEGALVVKAGTIWLGPDEYLSDGAVLIEDGRIRAVGRHVPVPRYARLIDAGPSGFVCPGFIDVNNHVAFEGDTAATSPDVTAADLVGAADEPQVRLAMAGITSVLLSPYRFDRNGSQAAAVKTFGADRDARVVRRTAAVAFDLRDADPGTLDESVGKRLEAAKAYLEKWQKYEKDLAEWQEKKDKGEVTEAKPKAADQKAPEAGAVDPITGIWEGTVKGGPLPEPMSGRVALRLTGTEIEGRVISPPVPMEHKIVATLTGDKITGQIEVDTGGMGYPQLEATLDRPDHFVGTISFQGISVDMSADRVEKKDVEFKVARTKTRGKDGRPLPPKVDESLEPLRAVLEKRIPALVDARTAAQIEAVLKLFVERYEAPLVLLNAEEASAVAERIVEKEAGVAVSPSVQQTRQYLPYFQAADLTRAGVPVAFQSNAEDGGRSLRRMVSFAVERGLSADAALAALTVDAARMFKLDDRIGTLSPGRDGDLVVLTGHPFEAGSSITHVVVAGQEVSEE